MQKNRLKFFYSGAALGDAIGLSTEFFSKSQAKELYGIGPIKFGTENGYPFYIDNHRARWKNGDWTDDTGKKQSENHSFFTTGGSNTLILLFIPLILSP
jgi:ADP-ribosylglycohydrolase